jgi:hypothetical protein
MTIDSNTRPQGKLAIVLTLSISLLISGSTGAAQTSENVQDLSVDPPVNETDIDVTPTDPESVTTADTSPDEGASGASGSIPDSEAPAVEPVQVSAPSRKPNRLTSAIERFTPTEEISADNAVPFPVDI